MGVLRRSAAQQIVGVRPRKAIAFFLAANALLFAAEPNPIARAIEIHKGDIPAIYTQFGYNTVVAFPKGEEITGVLAPETTFWSFNCGPNYLLIKAKGNEKQGHPGQRTNVSVTTASGNIYTFLIQETSTMPAQKFDLRVELEQDDADSLAAIQHPQFVRADLEAETQKQLEATRKDLERTKQTAGMAELHKIRHDYHWENPRVAEDLGITAIYHDDIFTYIESHAQEAPALYEIRDGRDSLVQATLQNGLYVVPKILDSGYLRLGKKKAQFERVKETA